MSERGENEGRRGGGNGGTVCPFCEAPISRTARKCRYCGEWVSAPSSQTEESIVSTEAGNPIRLAQDTPTSGEDLATGRCESRVIEVRRGSEKEKIAEMERYGWRLVNMVGVTTPTLTLAPHSTTTRYALHFVRSLGMPGLARVKQIEAQLPPLEKIKTPERLRAVKPKPGCLIALGVIAVLIVAGSTSMGADSGDAGGGFVGGIVFLVIAFFVFGFHKTVASWTQSQDQLDEEWNRKMDAIRDKLRKRDELRRELAEIIAQGRGVE